MGTEGLSIADAMSLANNGDFGGNGAWIFFLFFLLAWGGNGLWGNRGVGEFGQYATAASQQEILFGQQFQNIDNKLDRLGNGIADAIHLHLITLLKMVTIMYLALLLVKVEHFRCSWLNVAAQTKKLQPRLDMTWLTLIMRRLQLFTQKVKLQEQCYNRIRLSLFRDRLTIFSFRTLCVAS